MPAGRPTDYSQELVDEICEWLSDGKTLRAWCRLDGNPSFKTVYNWRDQDAEFSTRFARARLDGADVIAQEALDIADTPMEGMRRKVTDAGEEIMYEDMLGHRRLQVETRLKLLAKWFPQQYGDKLDMNLNGNLGIDMTVAEKAQSIRDQLRTKDKS